LSGKIDEKSNIFIVYFVKQYEKVFLLHYLSAKKNQGENNGAL